MMGSHFYPWSLLSEVPEMYRVAEGFKQMSPLFFRGYHRIILYFLPGFWGSNSPSLMASKNGLSWFMKGRTSVQISLFPGNIRQNTILNLFWLCYPSGRGSPARSGDQCPLERGTMRSLKSVQRRKAREQCAPLLTICEECGRLAASGEGRRYKGKTSGVCMSVFQGAAPHHLGFIFFKGSNYLDYPGSHLMILRYRNYCPNFSKGNWHIQKAICLNSPN